MTGQTERPEECDANGCHGEPLYEVAYTEESPYSYRWLCVEHKNRERIHDPHDTKVTTESWEVQ